MPTVAVVGAGIAGLTAAHELACRGYSVTVYDTRSRDAVGGKCRSQFDQSHGGVPLPGEHGFRFFPGFYRHVPEMMARIPSDPATANPAHAMQPFADSVADRLQPCDAMGIATPAAGLQYVALDRVDTVGEVVDMLRFLWTVLLPVDKRDVAYLSQRFLRFLCSCDERRTAEYGSQTLWDYVDGDSLHPETQTILQNVPRSLVAMDAKQGNTRTFFNTLWLMNSEWFLEQDSHRVLNGPSSPAWLWPWRDWLEQLGVTFAFDTQVTALAFDAAGPRVTGVTVRPTGSSGAGAPVAADHVVVAVPLEVAQTLVTADMVSACGQCAAIDGSAPGNMLGWMAGIQFYLREDAPILRGHVGYPYAAWGLTSVSQGQFWEAPHLAPFADIGGVLSVCITDVHTPDPVTGKPALASSADEIRQSVLGQLRAALHQHPDRDKLDDANIVAVHLDEDLTVGANGITANGSPLLIHPPGQWDARPEPVSGDVAGLYFAGDYVRNPMDLATMEGATAAARAAVNGVLEADASAAPRAKVYDLVAMYEPEVVKNRKALDQVLFDNGLQPNPLADVLHPLLDDLDDPDDLSLAGLTRLLQQLDVVAAQAMAAAGVQPTPPGQGFVGSRLARRRRAFAFDVGIPMLRADQDAWSHLIGRYAGRVPAPGRHIGIIRDLAALASDGFDPAQLHPRVRAFYHETTRFQMQAAVHWRRPLIGRLWSSATSFVGQLDPGPASTTGYQPFDTQLAALDFPESPLGARLWRRRLGHDRRPFYTAVVRPYIGRRRDGNGTVTHLNVIFPIAAGNLSVVLELTAWPGGAIRASSRRADTDGADTGTWIIPRGAPWAAVPAPLAGGEEIIIRPAGSAVPHLTAQHTAMAMNAVVLALSYSITP